MKYLLVIFNLVLFYTDAAAQLNLNIDDVPDAKNREVKKYRYYDTSYGLIPIVSSKNVIEIRLYEYEMFGARCQTLCFDGLTWTGQTAGRLCFAGESAKKLNTTLSFYQVLDTLNRNNIFKLPDQTSLNLKGTIDDGTNYSIVYKVGNKFRSYDFSNPKYFLKINKEVRELENYITIVQIFNSIYKLP